MVIVRCRTKAAETEIEVAVVCISIRVDTKTVVIGRVGADHCPAIDATFETFGEGNGDVAAVNSRTGQADGDIGGTGRSEGHSTVVSAGSGGRILHIERAASCSEGSCSAVGGTISGDTKRSCGGSSHTSGKIEGGNSHCSIHGSTQRSCTEIKCDGIGHNRGTCRLGRDGHIVQVEHKLVIAIEVTEGDIDRLARVSGKVNRFLLPSGLHLGRANRPLVQHGESRSAGGIGGGDVHTVMFGCIAGILSANPERERAVGRQGDGGSNQPVVRRNGRAGHVAERSGDNKASGTVMASAREISSCYEVGSGVGAVFPAHAIVVGINLSPTGRHARIEILRENRGLCFCTNSHCQKDNTKSEKFPHVIKI